MAERAGEQFGRLITAMVTPFDDNGEAIDAQRTITLAKYLADNKTTSIAVCGTTGESPTLDESERFILQGIVKESVGSRVKVIAGTSTYSTRESVHLSKRAQEEGADGLLLVTPYYSTKSQEGLKRHFAAIAESTLGKILLIPYNVPSRTGVNMEPDTVWWLAEHYPSIVGLKEANADREHVDRILNEKPENFTVWSGNDADTFYFLEHGGYGVVSVASHVVGRKIDRVISTYLKGEMVLAAKQNATLMPLFRALFSPESPEPSPSAIKACLNIVGIPVGSLRLPVLEVPETYKKRLETILPTVEVDPVEHPVHA